MKYKTRLILGILIFALLAISYFIPITLNDDINSSVTKETKTQLLGILIFFSPYVLALYILVALILIFYPKK